ncbi:carbohydrate kinase [uncultured Oscillibacter sp.]|uniref:carbohydrate kinase family protein n=1 Tax=uncultured Oscillibacter sp. TaxID=876091 RepID=UPI0025D6BE85|nr:carbohydrate kinase [uncultured Oscillibacter sp.]
MDVTAIGEILIDLTQTGVNAAGVPQFSANPGGAPANAAVAAARLGAETAFWGKVGDDSFGAYLRRVLAENGVDHTGLHVGSQPTTMAVVAVDETGERSFRFLRGADRDICPEEVDEDAVLRTKILHFGSVSLTAGMSRSATIFAARTAHRNGRLVSYDPNYRAALWASKAEAAEWMTIPLPLVDIIKLAEEELPLLTGTADLEKGTRILEERGVSLIMVTLGGEGVFCRWQGSGWHQPGIPVKVADTNGAGDTFLGAVLSRLCLRGERPLEGLTRLELKDILAFANRAAAFTCSRSGAIPAMPTLAELFDGKGQPRLP